LLLRETPTNYPPDPPPCRQPSIGGSLRSTPIARRHQSVHRGPFRRLPGMSVPTAGLPRIPHGLHPSVPFTILANPYLSLACSVPLGGP
jgi:hypothetical protein